MNPFYDQWSISEEFYMDALSVLRQRLGSKLAVIIFVGGSVSEKSGEADRVWVSKQLIPAIVSSDQSGEILTYTADDLNALTSMTAMSLCPNIIMGASTFSWWAGYLATDAKNIIAPEQQLTDTKRFNPKDHYLPEWTLLKPGGQNH